MRATAGKRPGGNPTRQHLPQGLPASPAGRKRVSLIRVPVCDTVSGRPSRPPRCVSGLTPGALRVFSLSRLRSGLLPLSPLTGGGAGTGTRPHGAWQGRLWAPGPVTGAEARLRAACGQRLGLGAPGGRPPGWVAPGPPGHERRPWCRRRDEEGRQKEGGRGWEPRGGVRGARAPASAAGRPRAAGGLARSGVPARSPYSLPPMDVLRTTSFSLLLNV